MSLSVPSDDSLVSSLRPGAARDRFSGALTSATAHQGHQGATEREANNPREDPADLLDGMPDLTAGLDTPLKKIIK